MATYVFKAMDLTGAKATGEVDAESKQVVSDQLKQRGLIVLDIADKHSSKEIKLAFLDRIKAAGPDDHDPAARHDGELGHDDPARALRARGADRVQAARRGHRQGPQGRRGRPAAVRRARAPPEDVLAAVRGDDPRRRDRRRARGVAHAGRRPAREGGLAPPPDQVGDGLPGRRPDLRAVGPHRPRDVPRPGLRRRVQAVRRRPADDHEVHRRPVEQHQGLLVGVDPHLGRRRRGPSASGRAPTAAAASGTRCACGSR